MSRARPLVLSGARRRCWRWSKATLATTAWSQTAKRCPCSAATEVGAEAPRRSPDHARAGRDRGDVAGGLVAARLGDGTERIEEARVEPRAVVDRKVDGAVAEALEHLAEAADAVPALAPHLLEIDLDGDELLEYVGAVEHAAGGIEHGRMAVAAGDQPVDVEDVALEHRGGRMGDGEIDVAVDGVGEHGMQQHLRTHGRQRAGDLREPDVVAVEDAELADLRHVEGEELRAGRDTLL